MFDSLIHLLLLLTSSVFAVGLFRILGLPAMLAYFVIGIVLGPHALGLLEDEESGRQVAEFGIVFLMFSIGLEFSLPKLYAMRKTLFGLGGGQVVLTLLASLVLGKVAGLSLTSAFIIGAAITMSSTAIVSKILMERVDLNSRHGRLSIGVLLFQDLAVIPILVLIQTLGSHSDNWLDVLGLTLFKSSVLLFLLFKFGKNILNFWFELVAKQRSRELFVLNVLMVTLLMAAATNYVGLSFALGAFVAGMLISETKYRYQVESDIAPFRDILLGLFFISVGMLLDVSVLINHIVLIVFLLALFLVFKIGLIAFLTKLYGFEMGVGVRTGIILGQAGEFSFVVLALGLQTHLIDGESLQLVLSVAVLSMLVAPFIIQYNGRIARKLVKSYTRNSYKVVETIQEHSLDLRDHVIICGYGRSGQYLGRFLREENIPYVALDMDASRVQEAAAAGENVIYGDAGRRSVLEAAGLARAKAVIVSYAETRGTMKVLHVIQEKYPTLPVIVRTHDDSEMDLLRDAGAAEVVPEILEGSLMLASHALVTLGIPLNRVVKRIRLFREERYKMFKGYFRGVSDADTTTAALPQLHSVEMYKNFYAHGLRLDHIPFEDFAVEVKQLRRTNMPEPIAPRPDIILNEGDILVLLGSNAALIAMEVYLISGRKP
ncbi:MULTISPECIES: cation:proton antiporter [unclassified Methylophilus]|uniref:Cation:proton antiporter n=1 Tax=Methylophilus glucosoxydans TaxID=752553 RepID=A0ABW3GCX7_9PROT|nr:MULTISPECIES: cation:proton antiporter [unclassified Methylophilus]MBF5040617.1 cation:proton antiporter [Methylophilus sp. 13]MDF0377955.1 potassium transporter [Methylophilus sp. YYY-1]MDT7849317.1 cation:proton antiporter [Methylophilus sp. VKM B-3414]